MSMVHLLWTRPLHRLLGVNLNLSGAGAALHDSPTQTCRDPHDMPQGR